MYALQSAGIDLFVSAKQASMHNPVQTCGPECPSVYFSHTAVMLNVTFSKCSSKDLTASIQSQFAAGVLSAKH